MGGHRLLLMGMVWVWVQIRSKMLGSGVKPPKAKPKVHRKKKHPTLFRAQNSPSNLTAKILSVFDFRA
jgi:hypothetical protein